MNDRREWVGRIRDNQAQGRREQAQRWSFANAERDRERLRDLDRPYVPGEYDSVTVEEVADALKRRERTRELIAGLWMRTDRVEKLAQRRVEWAADDAALKARIR